MKAGFPKPTGSDHYVKKKTSASVAPRVNEKVFFFTRVMTVL
jgi:hypothetical protein